MRKYRLIVITVFVFFFLKDANSQRDSVSYHFIDNTKSSKRFDFDLWIYRNGNQEEIKISTGDERASDMINFKYCRKGIYIKNGAKWNDLRKPIKGNKICLNIICIDSIERNYLRKKLLLSFIIVDTENVLFNNTYYFYGPLGLVALSTEYGLFFREDLLKDSELIKYINRLRMIKRDRELGRFKNNQ